MNRPMNVHVARTSRGVALLLVMWLITLLSALVGAFALTARSEAWQVRTRVDGLIAINAARAGVEYALTRVALSDPRLQWRPDGTPYQWRYDDVEVEVSLMDESGKVDLNQVEPTLLAALLQRVGTVEQTRSAQLAAAIVDWRDPDSLTQPAGGAEDADYAAAGLPYGAKDAAFESVAELEQVLGFTPALYAQLEPYLTVYSGRDRPDQKFAAEEVLDAMGVNGAGAVALRRDPAASTAPGSAATGSGTYGVRSRARLANGSETVLRAVISASVPTTVLRWEEGEALR